MFAMLLGGIACGREPPQTFVKLADQEKQGNLIKEPGFPELDHITPTCFAAGAFGSLHNVKGMNDMVVKIILEDEKKTPRGEYELSREMNGIGVSLPVHGFAHSEQEVDVVDDKGKKDQKYVAAILMQRAEGNGMDYMECMKGNEDKMKEEKMIMEQQVSARLTAIARNGMAAFDLKPENLLVNDGQLYLADWDEYFVKRFDRSDDTKKVIASLFMHMLASLTFSGEYRRMTGAFKHPEEEEKAQEHAAKAGTKRGRAGERAVPAQYAPTDTDFFIREIKELLTTLRTMLGDGWWTAGALAQQVNAQAESTMKDVAHTFWELSTGYYPEWKKGVRGRSKQRLRLIQEFAQLLEPEAEPGSPGGDSSSDDGETEGQRRAKRRRSPRFTSDSCPVLTEATLFESTGF